MPQPRDVLLVAIIFKTQRHPRGTVRQPSVPSLSRAAMSRHITLPITSPRQRNISVYRYRCLLACMPPTFRQPKTDGPQPVTSVCYLLDLARSLDSA